MDEQQHGGGQEAVRRRDPGALKRAMGKMVQENRLARPVMPRRMVTFTVDAAVCAPGVFDADFDLTIGGLTSAMELEAAQKAKGEVASLAFHYARLSLVAVNGVPLNAADLEPEWLWEALGTGGRQLVAGMFASHAFPDADAQGKALRTLRVDD
jgi:hypothetical protein